ncbi:hypothetical protein [Flavobacterium sp. GCM10027622]|uniref:hypothetical protein n=1 Tax=unclassified Flavobacterium TaxID=196869 RepID=UPI0036167187
MKKAFPFYFSLYLLFLTSCRYKNENEKEFNALLALLTKNYVNQEPYNQFTSTCWKVDKATFKKDSLDYSKGLDRLYVQELPFIRFLLNKREVTNEYNNWIETRNPCSSALHEIDVTPNKKGTLYLIDHLFTKKGKPIIQNKYVDKIKIEELKHILFEEGKTKDFNAIKRVYLNYINTIKQ